jgi:sterol desaturase/sphingolipid hydroxylase (fatty acid hydroxylase superfamily)
MSLAEAGAAASMLWSPAGFLALLFIGLASWEHLRPKRPPGRSEGWRWLTNGALFLLVESGNLWLTPFLASLVTPSFHGMFASGEPGLRLVAVLLAIDGLQYFLHRLSHALGWLWRMHAIHHTDIDVDVSTTIRHHPLESLVLLLAVAVIATVAGVTPGELALYGLIEFSVQLLAHANVALPARLERRMGALVVTPAFHRFHHALDPRQSNANYGQVLTIWDRLFGTLAAGAPPAEFGVGEYLAPRFQSLGWILLQPILPRVAAEAQFEGHSGRD